EGALDFRCGRGNRDDVVGANLLEEERAVGDADARLLDHPVRAPVVDAEREGEKRDVDDDSRRAVRQAGGTSLGPRVSMPFKSASVLGPRVQVFDRMAPAPASTWFQEPIRRQECRTCSSLRCSSDSARSPCGRMFTIRACGPVHSYLPWCT